MTLVLKRWGVLCGALLVLCCATELPARVRLESICTLAGQKEQKLVGLGLVVGLKGTGDGGKYHPTIQALSMALKNLNNPTETSLLKEPLKDTQNVAIVMIEATLPAQGVQRGQKVDCFVNAIGSAKSLRGGRLMVTPLQSSLLPDDRVLATAGGAIAVEDALTPTAGRIPQGVLVEEEFEEFAARCVVNQTFTLLLDVHHASFSATSEVARVINADVSFETNSRVLAKAVAPGVVKVAIPEQYRDAPVDFIAQVLDVGIDTPQTQARVLLNARTGVVVVTGEVELSPVIVSHKNLTIAVGDDQDNPDAAGRFVPVIQQQRQTSQNLDDLVKALNQLKVPPADVIDILRELHRSGKLHAALIVE